MGWFNFIAAFVVFFLSHSLPVRPPLRPLITNTLGERGFAIAYPIISIGVLTWLIIAAGRAPRILLWALEPWQAQAAVLLMFLACLLFALSVARPNPFSIGGWKNQRFDAARPGVVRLTRHPLLTAIAIWSGAHLLANGDLAHVILFATFALFSLMGRRLIDRRKRREMGARWTDLLQRVNALPLGAAFPITLSTFIRIAAGFVLCGALLWAHPIIIGVSPWSLR
ncbi:MAG: NnrU family protein [Pseudomonadota bacterium]